MKDNRKTATPANATPPAMPEFESIPAEIWNAGEDQIRKILNSVQPTSCSEDKRNHIVAYMRRLFNAIGVEVLQYGSVPFKTYLPDGDIDLTAVSFHDRERNLPQVVFEILLAEHLNRNDKFVIKAIQFIDAEVKLVKCMVNDIIIDISFNQLSGLCALCFLEQVDRLIEKDHLFKRSIILIKSWCYYESHILGAFRGLLSTYALETLVLYIFRMYNASLTTPLKVLYRFLEYFSKFDWDNLCVSIDGRVCVSSLPDIVGKKQTIDLVVNPANHPLFGEEYIREYVNMFTVPCKESVGYMPPFTPKVLNIIDPLKANNNLGRSIHSGTFHRIKYALGYGACKLGEILEFPGDKIQVEIEKFFCNTTKMNESESFFRTRVSFDTMPKVSSCEVHYEDDIELENSYSDHNTTVYVNRDLEGNDLSALSLVHANEKSVVGANANSSPGDDNTDATTKNNLKDDNLNLVDLSGDYHGYLRNLMYSQCRKGLPSSSVLVHEPAGHPSAVWYHQNSSHIQTYPNGSMMVPELNLTVYESGPFPPAGLPMIATGRGFVPPIPHLLMNWANESIFEAGSSSGANSNGPELQSPQGHGMCSAPSPVPTHRKLEFGSFGPVSPTGPDPEKTYLLCAIRPTRVPKKLLPLMDENEFPPLSV